MLVLPGYNVYLDTHYNTQTLGIRIYHRILVIMKLQDIYVLSYGTFDNDYDTYMIKYVNIDNSHLMATCLPLQMQLGTSELSLSDRYKFWWESPPSN